jgi:hypothetical protein
MSDSSEFLRLKQFWRFYVPLDEDEGEMVPLDGEILALFGTTEIDGRPYAQSVISLRCGQDGFVDLTIRPELSFVNLGLRNCRTNSSSDMGWWDNARWHPFALRWSELERLHQ